MRSSAILSAPTSEVLPDMLARGMRLIELYTLTIMYIYLKKPKEVAWIERL